jgi:tRNA(Arg) A34 adenosine deaminase TadA
MARLDGPEVEHLRRAIALAHEARERGNAPFGAVLIGGEGKVLAEGKNTVTTGGDVTGHAETNLVRRAYVSFDEQTLAASTLYASAEPCPMCSGAVFSAGVGRVVYGLGAGRIHEMFPPDEENPALRLSCRDVLVTGTRRTEVVGPALEAEAERVFEGLFEGFS